MLPLAVLSHIFPPSPSGQAVILYRLFKDWNSRDYFLLASRNLDVKTKKNELLPKMPAQYYYIESRMSLWGSSRIHFLDIANIFLQLLHRIRSIMHIIRNNKCSAIMACSGDLYDLPAGFFASRWARVPFCAYIFDDYLYQWTRGTHRFFARCIEPIMLRRAAAVIVPNEFLRDEYYRRYKIDSTVIHNSCGSAHIKNNSNVPWPSNTKEIKIVYTGAIYHAHFDAFRNLIAAIKLLNRQNVRLHLYTAQTRKELEREGIVGPIVYHRHMSPSFISVVQKEADILFLSLAFNSTISEVIKTSSPAKMGEYLTSGRPILVHAPVDSFISWYFKKYKCGIVVQHNKAKMIAKAIQRIMSDSAIRKQLVDNAMNRSLVDFSIESAQSIFFKLFKKMVS